MSFLSVWQRILEETDIKKLNELAEIVETTQPYISRKKKQDDFPVEWAYKVGRKYNLLTEWLLTGEGPKKIGSYETPTGPLDEGILVDSIIALEEVLKSKGRVMEPAAKAEIITQIYKMLVEEEHEEAQNRSKSNIVKFLKLVA
jgi:hypothetical protein